MDSLDIRSKFLSVDESKNHLLMELILNEDVILYIFSLLKPNPKYFRLSKKFYEMKNKYLKLHMIYINKPLKSYRDITNFCLLYYYVNKLKDDIGSYRKYILYFAMNKNRKSTIYSCINSYHRLLVHNFCEKLRLKHETIIHGSKKAKTCKSININIESDEYGEYYCSCNNCKYRDTGYGALDRFVCYTSLPSKGILITKI